jgi:multidrug efflux system outer membrane protein
MSLLFDEAKDSFGMSDHAKRSARIATTAAAASLMLVLGGCATPVLQPAVDVPGNFAAASASAKEPEVAWWESYGDPVLSDLVRRAAYRNRDVKMAAERVRAARGGETISRSWLLPGIGVSVSGFDHRTGYSSPIKQVIPEAADTRGAQGGVNVAWEIDVTGRLRAGAAAAAADTLAAEDTARAVRLLVVTDVATNYFTLVGVLRQLDTVRAIAAAQDETLHLVTARHRVGLATHFDVERAQTDASRARAAIPPLETLAAVSRHRIAVLIGDQAFNAATIAPSRRAITVPAAHAGQPAALLQRRPDLLAAKARLDAANARRQQAAAEWFPRLVLGAVFGRETLDANGVALGPARLTNVAAMLAMPVFNAGRTQAINDIAESAQREAVLSYEDAIVRALEDVENALVALHDEQQRAQLLQSAAASADAALGRADSLYKRGQIDLLPLLDAQRARLAVRLSANDSNTQLLLDSVQLYKALGGGWQAFENKEPS